MKEKDLGCMAYKGNSVGYIYDKLGVYREQLMTMVDLLRMVGIDYPNSGKDNNERRYNCLQQAEVIVEKLNDDIIKAQAERIEELEQLIERSIKQLSRPIKQIRGDGWQELMCELREVGEK